MNVALEDRAIGCLLAAACGDALGGGVELQTRAQLANAYPDGVLTITGGGPWRLDRGEITDDTHMALAIARACGPSGIDYDAVSTNFVNWMQAGPKDIGNATSAALTLIANGTRWQDAGAYLQTRTPEGVAGNGTVMRCVPLALRFRSDPVRLREASIETSRMTHADPRATWGAVALNQGIVHLLNGGSPDGVVEAAISNIEEPRVVEALTAAPDFARDALRSGGYVLDTLTSSLWCLLHEDSLEESIVAAVMLGDDTDTTATVTGALAGAFWGPSTIPEQWRSVLQVRDEVTSLALDLIRWDRAEATSD